MSEVSFGEFLHTVRLRAKGTQIAKAAGISYVYLLDIEKGARPVPSDTVLLALANVLPFVQSEREMFFDLAAAESDNAPLDIAIYLRENKDIIPVIRKLIAAEISVEAFNKVISHIEGSAKGGVLHE